jgi:hypothetical protein
VKCHWDCLHGHVFARGFTAFITAEQDLYSFKAWPRVKEYEKFNFLISESTRNT